MNFQNYITEEKSKTVSYQRSWDIEKGENKSMVEYEIKRAVGDVIKSGVKYKIQKEGSEDDIDNYMVEFTGPYDLVYKIAKKLDNMSKEDFDNWIEVK
ncbi:MAG: hypothetical protein WC755_09150 [Candidatus Woesearchaeota archaeon]|jgi:hypothetical protein